MKIAIIGAGISGLACAQELRARLSRDGNTVTLFDKSHGPGGRMAVRCVKGFVFDHGAQYFTARGEAFSALVRRAIEHDIAAECGNTARFVGTPSMNAFPADLARGLDIRTGFTLKHIEREAQGWTLPSVEGAVAGGFDQVIFAIPAPQALAIFTRSGVDLPGIEKAEYAPCWALLLGFAEGQAQDCAPFMRFENGPVRLVTQNHSKPNRDATRPAVVVHAGPEWSRLHLELPQTQIKSVLLDAYALATGHEAMPVYIAAHRWRYALVEEPAGVPFLYDAELGLGACGDWCIGPRIEAAFDSGRALAQAILS